MTKEKFSLPTAIQSFGIKPSFIEALSPLDGAVGPAPETTPVPWARAVLTNGKWNVDANHGARV